MMFVSHATFLLFQWPFTRILGIQEPASVIFSVFNFIAHYVMIRQFRREVRRNSPMYWLWHAYALVSARFPLANFVWLPDQYYIFNTLLIFCVVFLQVCLNCWFWSCVFHTRDTPFTEKMDYFSAFSAVLFSFYAMIVRCCYMLPLLVM